MFLYFLESKFSVCKNKIFKLKAIFNKMKKSVIPSPFYSELSTEKKQWVNSQTKHSKFLQLIFVLYCNPVLRHHLRSSLIMAIAGRWHFFFSIVAGKPMAWDQNSGSRKESTGPLMVVFIILSSQRWKITSLSQQESVRAYMFWQFWLPEDFYLLVCSLLPFHETFIIFYILPKNHSICQL